MSTLDYPQMLRDLGWVLVSWAGLTATVLAVNWRRL